MQVPFAVAVEVKMHTVRFQMNSLSGIKKPRRLREASAGCCGQVETHPHDAHRWQTSRRKQTRFLSFALIRCFGTCSFRRRKSTDTVEVQVSCVHRDQGSKAPVLRQKDDSAVRVFTSIRRHFVLICSGNYRTFLVVISCFQCS